MARSIPRISLVFDEDDLTKISDKISLNTGVHSGEVAEIKVGIPNWTNNPNLTLSLLDKNGITIWSQNGFLKSGGNVFYYTVLISRPLIEQETIKGTLSGAAGGTGGTVTVDIDYYPDEVG